MKKFFVKIDYSWECFEADTVKELLFNIASYYGITDELFTIALTNCPEGRLVDMFNRFASSCCCTIEGIWELGNHIFGDEK